MDESLLAALVGTPSVSGYEENLQQVVAKQLKSRDLSVNLDTLGNCISKIGDGSRKVLIAAHADEVGFIITHISNTGFLYFQPVGGIDEDIAVGQVVAIQTKQGIVRGII